MAAIAGLGLAGCNENKDTPSASGSSKNSEGGSLTMYTPNSETLTETLIPDFEKRTGIKVDLIQAGTGELFTKLEGEKDNPIADVVWGAPYTRLRAGKDLFDSYTAPDNDKVIEAYRNVDGYSTPYGLDGSVILVNKDLCKGIKVRGYADLLNSKLAGKIASADPTNSASAFAHLTNMLKDMGGYDSEDAWKYVKKLFTAIQGKIASSSSNVYKTVADGEMSVGLSYEDPCVQLLIDGANVEIVYPKEGCVFLPYSSAMIAKCKHPAQAKKWIDYSVSATGQKLIARKTTVRPVRSGEKLNKNMKPFDKIPIVEEDFDYVIKHVDDITSRYSDIATSVSSAS